MTSYDESIRNDKSWQWCMDYLFCKIHKKHHVICSQEAIMLSAGGEAPPIYSRSTNFCRRAPEHRRHATTRRCTRSDQTGGSAPSWNCDPGVSLEDPPYTAAGSVLVPPRPTP